MKAVIILSLLALALPAQAQVYKCTEGGKTVYSQMPCAADAKPVELKVHQPTEADRLRAEAQSLREQAVNARNDGERMAAERRSRAAAEARQAEKDAKARKCAEYQEEIKRREGTKDKWASGALRQQDHDRIRELNDKHFTECFTR